MFALTTQDPVYSSTEGYITNLLYLFSFKSCIVGSVNFLETALFQALWSN